MATKATVNKLVLKVAVVLDDAQLKKAAKDGQKVLDKQHANTIKGHEQANKAINDTTNKNTVAMKKQGGVVEKLSKQLKRMTDTAIAGLVFWKAIGAAKDAVQLAIDLDTAFTNLSIVSKATAQEIAAIETQVDALTISLGRMKREVIDSVTEFSRAGFSISDSLLLAENAIKGANVGATSLEKVTTFLVAGLKSFKLEAEDSAKILDVLFRVANTTAINLEGIGEAFLRSANTLNTAGASLEQSAALIAAANESIQDPAKVGTALKTIASRLRGVGDEGEVIPTLAKDFKNVGIEIQNADGSFRNIYDIFKDLSVVYKDLDDLTRQSLFEKIAGKRQINILIGLLDNFAVAEKSFDNALKSAGEVALAQEKFIDSLQGKVNLLKEAWNQFLTSLTNSKALKITIDGLTGIITAITTIINKVPIVISAISALIAVFAPISLIPTIIAGVVSAFFALKQASDLFSEGTQDTIEKIQSLSAEIDILNGRIGNLKSIEDRSDAENNLLKTYEEQLSAKKRLLALENKGLSEAYLKDAEKVIASIKDAKIDESLVEALSMLESGAASYYIEQKKVAETLQEQELQLLQVREASFDLMQSVDENSDAYKNAKKAYTLVNEELLKNVKLQVSLGLVTDATTDGINGIGDAVNSTKTSVQEFNEALAQSKSQVAGQVDKYQSLSDAYIQLTQDGYLSSEMLDELLVQYPDLIQKTGLAKDALLNYLESTGKRSRETTQSIIADTRVKIKALEAEIATYFKLKSVIDGDIFKKDNLKGPDFFGGLGSVNLGEMNATIQDGLNQIKLYENELGAFDSIDKSRNKVIEDRTKSTEKEIRVLTDLESQIRSVNQEIQMEQKLLSRTEDVASKVAINERLAGLYQTLKEKLIEQRDELDKNNKSLKKGQDGYEDYIDATMKLSLEIEDATNNIFGFTKANADLIKELESDRISKLNDEIKAINETFQEDLKEQIEFQKDLAKKRAEYYKNEIEDKKKEIEALQEQNEAIDDQVRLQELLLDLQTLRERRQNILDNKNVRMVRDADTGFEWVSDPRELKQVNEDIANAEQAIEKFRRDMLVKENQRRLELEIEGLEKEAQAAQDSYDKRIEELEIFQDAINDAISNNQPIPIELVQTLQNNLQSVENTSYGIRLDALSTFISDYNSKMAEMTSAPITSVAPPAQSAMSATSIVNGNASGASKPSGGSSGTGGVKTSTPPASSIAKKITPVTSAQNSKPPVSINTMNVMTGSKTLDGALKDSINRVNTIAYY